MLIVIGLKEIIFGENFDTSNVTYMYQMFYGAKGLTTLPQFNAGKATNIIDSFSIRGLVNFGGLLDLGKGYVQKSKNYNYYQLVLSTCTKLTHDSLMNVINGLYDLNLTYNVAGGGTLYTQTLNLGATNKAKLTAEEIAIATNKGWNVA